MVSCGLSFPIWLFVFVMLALSAYSGDSVICDCCCTPHAPPPPPPSPSPPPPSPPTPSQRCPRREDIYNWEKDTNCRTCADKCTSNCLSLNKGARQLDCTDYGSVALWHCCCTPHTPPPTFPSPPPPLYPSPQPPPVPVPRRDKCDPGDDYLATTFTTSDCSYCKTCCKEKCLEQVINYVEFNKPNWAQVIKTIITVYST
ncbi:hypothetical protein MKW92_048265 [Papaver armeniacum]|nr:hypothetical protein MKW92_048265 [Papaver armeniacum]